MMRLTCLPSSVNRPFPVRVHEHYAGSGTAPLRGSQAALRDGRDRVPNRPTA
jgi:hypothetical protein